MRGVLFLTGHRNFILVGRAVRRLRKSSNPPPDAMHPRGGEKRGLTVVTKTKLIVNLTRGDAVCVGELADGPLRRMRGLIGRPGLPAGEGLLLSPAPAIHTAFMRFPIDALFLDRDLRVLDIVEQLGPWRVASKYRARAVLELSAGECARRGVEVGDRLELRDRAGDPDTPGPGGTPATHWQEGELARLQPLRILVISPDRHFRTVMSLLLSRRNCSTATTANASRLTELIARERADIVVIDISQLANAAAAAAVATVEALSRPVGVLLVADEERPGPADEPVSAKWGPFGDLMAAIERADEQRGTWGDTDDRE
jgi:uncharacterized protein